MGNWKTLLFVIVLFLMIRQCGSCIGCSSSKDSMMEEAYKAGKSWALEYRGAILMNSVYEKCERHFLDTYGYPETENDIELYQEYKEKYEQGFEDGLEIRREMHK